MHSKNQRRHGSPSVSRTPLVPMKPKVSVSHGGVDALPFRVPRDYPHSRFSKAPLAVYPPKGARAKACVSLPVVSLEKMPCFGRADSGHVKVSSTSTSSSASSSFTFSSSSSSGFSSLTSSHSPVPSLKSSLGSLTPHKAQEKFLNGRGPPTPRSTTPPSIMDRRPSPSSSPLDRRPTPSPSSQDRRPNTSPSPSSLDKRTSAPPSPLEKKQQNGTKGSKHKRVSGRVFDPNKHCGVLDPETKRPCTRSLTCKTHSLTHRRAVPGRRKDFDVLLAEHKGRAKEKEAQSHDPTPAVSSNCQNGKTTSTLKLRLVNPQLRRSSGGGAIVSLSSTQVPTADPIATWQRLVGDVHVSSDEGEADVPDDSEKPICHYSVHHPRPMSCCAFNSRLMGRGHYVFDRRWDKMRLTLHRMVEKHVNSQMWRKVPLAAESLALSTTPSPSDATSTGSGLHSSPLFPQRAVTPSLDGVTMVSYSTSFSQNGAGVFCIRDPDPAPVPSFTKQPRAKPNKSQRHTGEGQGVKRRKTIDSGFYRKNDNGYHSPGNAVLSNGTAALSVKSKTSVRVGQGLRFSDRYVSEEAQEPSTPNVSVEDHFLSSTSSTPFGAMATDNRKRRRSGSGDKISKFARTAGLDSIFRKSNTSLLTTVPEATHSPLPQQPKVNH
ncbi:ataxin-7-like protein 1 isoform X2 [Denticeps clupeoides]|uniref:SCA7 domain-containing protein n=1 Tax=Denticeps clupeoides TaxID=299321 RepID=A0AAY4DKG1_9TELE|nr:ataxin-7-like protein 1 isoform X2 [Denticeps clupeoides]